VKDDQVLALCVLSGAYKFKEEPMGVLKGTKSAFADDMFDIIGTLKRKSHPQSSVKPSANDSPDSHTGCYMCRCKLGVVGFINTAKQQIICAGAC